MSDIRFDPYAPTPGWVPPPRDDAPSPHQEVIIDTHCHPRNPYWTADCHVRVDLPPVLMVGLDDEQALSFGALTGAYAFSSGATPGFAPPATSRDVPESVPEPAMLVLLLAAGIAVRLRRALA